VGRCNDIHDTEHSAQLHAGFVHAFEYEDKPMIAAQSKRLNGRDFWEMKPLLLPTDAGAVRARRILLKLIEVEQEKAATLAVRPVARNEAAVGEMSEDGQ
jgi:vanillate O-demethylase monooxygenase subunit